MAATPIGNAADSSPRLARALADADLIAAEDTRKLLRLAGELGVRLSAPVLSHFEGNEVQRLPALLAALRDGKRVLLVTDAGMPAVSDPGHRLIREASAAGFPVQVLPGPSAAVAALVASGLPTDRWCFEGFLPRRGAARRKRLAELAGEERTIVVFESPHRVVATLADLAAVLGTDRGAALCRELTKTHEEVRRGPLGELHDWAAATAPRGEITLVVGGAGPARSQADPALLAADVAALTSQGLSRRDAVRSAATSHGVSTREVYAALADGPRGGAGENRSGPAGGSP